MFSANTIRVIIGGTLLLHGIAHLFAGFALIAQGTGGISPGRLTIESWLFTSTSPQMAAWIALLFYVVAALGFVLAALSFWGVVLDGHVWRQIALIAAVISIIGIVLFSGVWPGSQSTPQALLNLAIATVVNGAVLATQLVLHWPPETMFGK